MNIKRWIARRELTWQQLDTLLKQVENGGLKSLSATKIHELASLYRSVSGDLARARTHQVGKLTVQNLQQLTSRGYAQIYQGSRRKEWRSLLDFYLWGLPAAVQQSRGYIALSVALLVGMGVFAWWLAWAEPMFLDSIAPPHILEQVRDRGELWMGSIVGVEPFASAYIMRNNIQVSFGAIAGGITAGIYTIFILLVNGLNIGALSALVAQNNLSYPFWAFVLPHGSLELPAIFLAAGAGFLIARAIVFPGRYRRIDALKVYGQQAAHLVFGVVPMLVIAGIIEGFFSPNPAIPDLIKYIVGTALFIGLMTYFGRRKRESMR